MEYTFKHLKTGKIVTHEMKISEYDEFKKNHPELERYIESAPKLASGDGNFESKTDDTWKEVLAKIGENHTSSNLADKYRKNKSIKEIKTKQIIDKHVKKAQNQGRV